MSKKDKIEEMTEEEAQTLIDQGEAEIPEEAVIESVDEPVPTEEPQAEASTPEPTDAEFLYALAQKLENNRVVAGVTAKRIRDIADNL